MKPEPVACIMDVWELRWVGSGPITPIIEKHGQKIGDKLYGPQVAARLAEIEAVLPEILDAISEGWGDIQELVRHAKYVRDSEKPMFITENGINQSEVAVANLKAAARKLRMWQEGITEQDIHETKPEI